jgi:hypothetical protein
MPHELVLLAYLTLRRAAQWAIARGADERGEGVISAAIAVLIMAFLGAAMWVIFRQILEDSGSRTDSTLDQIGGG